MGNPNSRFGPLGPPRLSLIPDLQFPLCNPMPPVLAVTFDLIPIVRFLIFQTVFFDSILDPVAADPILCFLQIAIGVSFSTVVDFFTFEELCRSLPKEHGSIFLPIDDVEKAYFIQWLLLCRSYPRANLYPTCRRKSFLSGKSIAEVLYV